MRMRSVATPSSAAGRPDMSVVTSRIVRWSSSKAASSLHGKRFDAIIVGGGHNGLVAAGYLAKAGKSVAVFERRSVLGGAAVTEEIIPGFKFSRASYLLSLLRPQIVQDLDLKSHGLRVYLRDPNSFAPVLGTNQYLLLGNDAAKNRREIGKFSQKDAERYEEYGLWMEKIADSIIPLLDNSPVNLHNMFSGSLRQRLCSLKSLLPILKMGSLLGGETAAFYELMSAPASKILDRWFESEPLKAVLATDSVIGAMLSPYMPGSSYVLLHHVMGELEGRKDTWGYAEGGMGGVSQSIARAAKSYGASLHTDCPVSQITVRDGCAVGVQLQDGTEVRASVVLSNATPKVTFLDLLKEGALSREFESHIRSIDYTSPVTKINVALSGLPNFSHHLPNCTSGKPSPHHQCTIHLNCESTELIHEAYLPALHGHYSDRPMLEFCLLSSLDPTLAPPGCHVASIFSQYTPYHLKGGWTEEAKERYAEVVFNSVEAYCPGFKKLVVGKEVLTPPDLERVFGLTGGNIFHGAMSLDQLYISRPSHLCPSYSTPLPGLYLCGSGAHPGGGVMGSPGRLAALTVLNEI